MNPYRKKYLGKYENEQYVGGRPKGRPNLKKVGRSQKVENQWGVQFTPQDRKKLENLVNSANQKRRRLLKDEQTMQLFGLGENLGVPVSDSRMGRESDFVFARKSKSLHQFKTRDEFNNYLRQLRKVVDRQYIARQSERYKKNYVKAMRNQGFNKDVIKQVRQLSQKDFLKLSRTEELVRFGYVYDERQKASIEQSIVAGIARVKS